MKIKRHFFVFLVYVFLSALLLFFCLDEEGLKYEQVFAVFFLLAIGAYIFHERNQKAKLIDQLESDSKSLQQILDLSLDGIFIENERGEILDCNKSGHEMFGYSKEEMLTLSIRDLVPEEFAKDLPEILPDDMVTGNRYVERVNKRKDGTLFPTEIYTQYLNIGGEKRLIAYIRDMSQRKKLENRLKSLSIRDDLTGVYNRRYMIEQLDKMVELLKRDETNFFSIVLLDLDDFKRVNDLYGHICGDSVLKSFSETLRSGLRKIDIVGRYGGDEFLAIMPKTTCKNGCTVLNRFRSQLNSIKLDIDVKISFSAGIVEVDQISVRSRDLKELLNFADIAMYRAKEEGKDRTVCSRSNCT